MDAIGSVSTAISQTQLNQDISVAVLKKALQVQSEGAMSLLQALPDKMYSNPPNLGQNVDLKA